MVKLNPLPFLIIFQICFASSRCVQRRMVHDLFLLLIYGSVDEYKFADTGDESLDDVLNDMFGEIIFHLRGVQYFTEDCGMPPKRALETYFSILNNYPYK